MPTRAPFAHQNSVRLQTCLQFPVCSSHATDSVMEQTKTEETPTPKSRKQAGTYDMAQRIIAQPVQNTNLASNNSRPQKKSTSDHRPTRILRSYQKQTTRIDADHDTTNDLAINSAVLRPRQLDNKKILPSTYLHDYSRIVLPKQVHKKSASIFLSSHNHLPRPSKNMQN